MTLSGKIRLGGVSALAIWGALLATSASASSIDASAASEQSADAATSGVGGDIVVTARRRAELGQDIPVAVTAFSTEKIERQNITTGQALNGVVPSLQVGNSGQATRDVETFTLRGQGPTYQGSSSVVVYLEDVPLPQNFTTNQQGGPGNYVDLENVQVLAGPQGTLFGRNTTGGAVLLVPHKPTNNFEGYLKASYGNYNYVGVEGVINIPLIEDKLLVRIVGNYQDRDGFTRDVVWNKDRDNLHYYSGRIGITFKPTETIENYLMVYGAKSRTNGTTFIHKSFNLPLLQFVGLCAAPCTVYQKQTDLAAQLGPRATRLGVDQFDSTDTWGVINKTSIELSQEVSLKNIFSYQEFRKDYLNDADGTPLQHADIASRNYPTFPVAGLAEFGIAPTGYSTNFPSGPRDDLKQWTEELQIQGNFLENKLQVTAGGFFYDQKPAGPQLNRAVFFCAAAVTGTAACTPTYQAYSVATQSKALFAQASLDLGVLTPALAKVRLTGGYRYTWDTIKGAVDYYSPFPGGKFCIASGQVILDSVGGSCASNATLKSSAPTWTVGLDYKPASNLLLFAKVSRGYKAGGYNPFAVRVTTRTFLPEYVTSWEAGLKSDWTIGSMPGRFNLTAYTTNYKDKQNAIADGNGAQVVQSNVRIRGFEAELTVRPIPALEIGGNLSHTDAENRPSIATVATTDCNGPVAVGGTIDNSCTPYPVSRWIYNIHASLDLPVPESWGKLNFYANYSHLSEQPINTAEPGGILEPYGLLNLSLNWKNVAQGPVDVEFFMTNATNKLYRIGNSGIFRSVGFWSVVYGEPRMFGARVRYRFGS